MDGDECEKGTRRSSRLPKNIFGGQVSVGGYASAGFAGAVKMPRVKARGGFTLTEGLPEIPDLAFRLMIFTEE